MELSPYSAASNAFHAAALIRLVAEKPKKEDYSDYKRGTALGRALPSGGA